MTAVQILEAATRTKANRHARITGAPELDATYLDQTIQPQHIWIRYVYHLVNGEPTWTATQIIVEGFRVLKPARDGSQRLGKQTHIATWTSWDLGHRTTSRNQTPAWLDDVVEILRPSGGVGLPFEADGASTAHLKAIAVGA